MIIDATQFLPVLRACPLLLLSPLILTSATAIVVMLMIALRRSHWWNATVAVTGLNVALLSVVGLYLVVHQFGPASLTPLLQLDAMSCLYMGLVLVATLACMTLSHAYMEGYKGNKEELYLLMTISCLGALVMVQAHHLASLFIGLELLSVPIYGLVAYTFHQQKSLEASIKYLVLSAAASAFMLFGMALLYADSGRMTFGQVSMALAFGMNNPIELLGVGMLLIGFAFKLSLAPFHLWTPDVYEGAPAPVSAYLASVSKLAVFAVFMRFLEASHSDLHPGVAQVISALALLSIVVGNLLALQQNNVKRLLGYSSIAHFGYLLIAFVMQRGVFDLATTYLVTYLITTLASFGVVTLMSSPYHGKDADGLQNYRGLFWQRPYLTAVMTVSMLSLAGIPMTAGFIGKFYLLFGGTLQQTGVGYANTWIWALFAALVVGSAMGLYYYLRVVVTMFMPTPGMRRFDAPANWGRRFGGLMVLGLAALVLVIGLYPGPLLALVHTSVVAMRMP